MNFYDFTLLGFNIGSVDDNSLSVFGDLGLKVDLPIAPTFDFKHFVARGWLRQQSEPKKPTLLSTEIELISSDITISLFGTDSISSTATTTTTAT